MPGAYRGRVTALCQDCGLPWACYHRAVHELVDIGANLTNKAFTADLAEVLARARAAGVAQIVVTGTSCAGSAAAADLALANDLVATAGIHPHNAQDYDPEMGAELQALLARPTVVAVGECGLDYNRMFSPREAQLRCFEAQLVMAAQHRKPLFLHERDAGDDMLALLREHRKRLTAAVIHCFTGTGALLDAYLALDLHIGITGWICDERRGRHLRDLVARIPADRLMLETDAPYLLPRTPPGSAAAAARTRDRRNEPAFLPLVLQAVAEAQGRPAADVARETTAAARAFFALA
jgi:TatD DNase family protein